MIYFQLCLAVLFSASFAFAQENQDPPQEAIFESVEKKTEKETKFKHFRVDLDYGLSNSLKNDVRIPNPGGTEFSLRNTQLASTFRAYFTYAINSKHSIRVLYAPFSGTQKYTPKHDIDFNGSTYLAGNPIDAHYKFNSYRLGYIYNFEPVGDFAFRIGFTNKIRHARIGLGPNAATTGNGYNDVGYVPLAHFGSKYGFLEKAFIDMELEGLAVPGAPGRAIELTSQFGYAFHDNVSLSAGYRFIEGGANTKIYNFSFLQTFFTRLSLSL